MEKRCAQCGARDDLRAGSSCWCAELPHIPMPTTTKVLCRNCLLAKIERCTIPPKEKSVKFQSIWTGAASSPATSARRATTARATL